MADKQKRPQVRTFSIKLALTVAAITATLGGWAGLSATSMQDAQTTTTQSAEVVVAATPVTTNMLVAQVVPAPVVPTANPVVEVAPTATETVAPVVEVVPTATTVTEQTTQQSSANTQPMARTRSSR